MPPNFPYVWTSSLSGRFTGACLRAQKAPRINGSFWPADRPLSGSCNPGNVPQPTVAAFRSGAVIVPSTQQAEHLRRRSSSLLEIRSYAGTVFESAKLGAGQIRALDVDAAQLAPRIGCRRSAAISFAWRFRWTTAI